MARYQEFSVGKLTREPLSNGKVNVLDLDSNQLITRCEGTSVPANSLSGYKYGCQFTLTSAVSGQHRTWTNVGSSTSTTWAPYGPTYGYGISKAFAGIASQGGDTTEIITVTGGITPAGISFVDHDATDDTDTIVAQITGDNKITITGSADPSTTHSYQGCVLENYCQNPEWGIFAAGTHTTAGGAAAEAITVTGASTNDVALVSYSATNDTDTIAMAVLTANTLTVTMSADPSTAHGLHYAVLRKLGGWRPSHYIFASGVHTTVGGDATEVITVTGATSSDVAIVHWNTTNDTDTILKSVLTADTLTVTLSADPLTAHKLAYMVLKAY